MVMVLIWQCSGCCVGQNIGCFFFFKQKTAYEIMPSLVGSEMCIRDRIYLYPEYKEKNIVTREIIQKIVEYEEIPLSKQELDFWYLKLYELSHQINSFSMDDVLYTFRAYEQQQFQEIQQLQIPQNPVSHQNQ
eukprot:TRINITY_DN3947_c0_g1_i2.p1 TRINITY_DN3947_c0_g1~~TRINITY_DN3947_c0_g1_i2.p1  ORF type:complete len:133 (-),score=19.32 TRINITY_DN3947_c0_g1_i2:203-601(-)